MAASHGQILLTNAVASSALFNWPGGQGLFAAVASAFNGATVKLQYLGPDGVTLLDAGPATTLVANGGGIFYLPPGQIQCTITGGPPAGVYASAARIVQ